MRTNGVLDHVGGMVPMKIGPAPYDSRTFATSTFKPGERMWAWIRDYEVGGEKWTRLDYRRERWAHWLWERGWKDLYTIFRAGRRTEGVVLPRAEE